MSKKRRRRKRRLRRRVIITLLILTTALVTLASPLFNIESVSITGGEKVEHQQILMASGIVSKVNIFRISTRKAEKRIASIPYIDTVKVRRILPHTVSIEVTECTLLAYVPYMGSMAGIDKNGKVLEVIPINEVPDKIIVETVEPKKIDPGTKIGIDESQIIDIIVLYLQKFEEYGVYDTISRLNVPSTAETGFTTKSGLIVNFGSTDDIDYKFKMYQSVIEKIGSDSTGVLDMTNPQKVAHRKNL